MKRAASTALAGALALSMAVPAFATASPAPNSTTIDAAYKAVTLKVTVPTTGSAIINPYGLPVKLGEQSISGEQITTGTALTLQNKSTVALDVSAEVTVTIPTTSAAEYASTWQDNETGKKFNVSLEVFHDNQLAGDVDKEALNAAFAKLNSEDADMTATPTAKDAAGKDTCGGDGSVVLKEGTTDGALQKGGAAYFRLSGNVVKKPTTAWAATDTFSVAIAWTFEPTIAYETVNLSITGKGDSATNRRDVNNESTNIDVTITLPQGVTIADDPKWSVTDANGKAQGKISVAAKASDTTKATGTVTVLQGYTTTESDEPDETVTVTFTGSDGKNYKGTVTLYFSHE